MHRQSGSEAVACEYQQAEKWVREMDTITATGPTRSWDGVIENQCVGWGVQVAGARTDGCRIQQYGGGEGGGGKTAAGTVQIFHQQPRACTRGGEEGEGRKCARGSWGVTRRVIQVLGGEAGVTKRGGRLPLGNRWGGAGG